MYMYMYMCMFHWIVLSMVTVGVTEGNLAHHSSMVEMEPQIH